MTVTEPGCIPVHENLISKKYGLIHTRLAYTLFDSFLLACQWIYREIQKIDPHRPPRPHPLNYNPLNLISPDKVIELLFKTRKLIKFILKGQFFLAIR